MQKVPVSVEQMDVSLEQMDVSMEQRGPCSSSACRQAQFLQITGLHKGHKPFSLSYTMQRAWVYHMCTDLTVWHKALNSLRHVFASMQWDRNCD